MGRFNQVLVQIKKGRDMFRKILFFFTALSSFVFGQPLIDRSIDMVALNELASGLGIPEGSDLLEETQKRWLRAPGQEMWEKSEISSDQRHFVLNWAKQQGLFTQWLASSNSYDKALIFGASTHLMQSRLNHLKEAWLGGVRFQEIVWLTGDRLLDRRIDGFVDVCKNESEAAQILWESADLPEDLRKVPVSFIAVPMNGKKRPNTKDTIVAWLDANPEHCKVLFVSSQPFCGYQFATVNKNLPDSFLFDVIGPGIDPTGYPTAATIVLETVARWLYTHNTHINATP